MRLGRGNRDHPVAAADAATAVEDTVAALIRCVGLRWSALFIFDESEQVLLRRTAGLGIDMERHVREGNISVEYVNVAELSPGEFASRVAAAADRERMSVVVIDSLNGYLNAMPSERYLLMHMHELLGYLGM